MSIPWPDVFATFLNTLKVAMLDLLTLTRTGCATPMTFYDNLLVTLCLFAGGSAFGFVVLVVMDARQRRSDAELHKQATTAMRTLNPHTFTQPTVAAVTAAARWRARTTRRETARQPRQSLVQSTVNVASEIPSSLRGMRWGRVFKSLAVFWTLCYPGSRWLGRLAELPRAWTTHQCSVWACVVLQASA